MTSPSPETLEREREKPKRIQRKRTRGWKMPPNTVYVGRSGRGTQGRGKWGNPYRTTLFRNYTPAAVVADYRQWLARNYAAVAWAGEPPTCEEIQKELRGKNLACFCALDQPCHADVLLEIANR